MTAERLSPKAVAVLKMIASGHTYEQILTAHPELAYPDIFTAAQEALDVPETKGIAHADRLARIRQKYPRAYEKWTPEEDERLEKLVCTGRKSNEIAAELERQPSAIRSRMVKLGLQQSPQGEESTAESQDAV